VGEGSLYPKGRNPLNNKPRGRWEKVLLILQEEILSKQQTKEKTGEGSPTRSSDLLLGLLLR
jgi:hypothetical protein